MEMAGLSPLKGYPFTLLLMLLSWNVTRLTIMVPSNARCWFCHIADDYYVGDGWTLDMLQEGHDGPKSLS